VVVRANWSKRYPDYDKQAYWSGSCTKGLVAENVNTGRERIDICESETADMRGEDGKDHDRGSVLVEMFN